MSWVFLLIGTIMVIVFLVLMFKGQKYDYMLEGIEGDTYPFKFLYSVGLALQDYKIVHLKGKVGEKLRSYSTLLYSKQYSEFYARITWAQALSLSFLCLILGFLGAGLLGDDMVGFCVLIGVALAVFVMYYFLTYLKEKIVERKTRCEIEFPDAISKLALIVNSGVILHEAWKIIAYGKEGVFYDLMKASCVEMDNGKSDVDAIYEFGVLTNSDGIKKFTSALIQSVERGGGDLPHFLINQSAELWANKRQTMLQKGEKAAGALLMPIAIMFLGTMVIVLAAAMQSFGL